MSININQCLELPTKWPLNIISIEYMYRKNLKIDVAILPKTVRRIIFSKWKDEVIIKDPTNQLRSVKVIGSDKVQFIDIPMGLTNLIITNNDDQKSLIGLDNLPQNLKQLKLNVKHKYRSVKLPINVVVVSIKFDCLMMTFPESLKVLYIGEYFDSGLVLCDTNIRKLSIQSEKFNSRIIFPENLFLLNFSCDEYNSRLILPENISILTIEKELKRPIKNFPPSLVRLNMMENYEWQENIKLIPNLEYYEGAPIDIDTINYPTTIRILSFESNYGFFIDNCLDSIPKTIEILRFYYFDDEEEQFNIEDNHFPNLRKIYFCHCHNQLVKLFNFTEIPYIYIDVNYDKYISVDIITPYFSIDYECTIRKAIIKNNQLTHMTIFYCEESQFDVEYPEGLIDLFISVYCFDTLIFPQSLKKLSIDYNHDADLDITLPSNLKILEIWSIKGGTISINNTPKSLSQYELTTKNNRYGNIPLVKYTKIKNNNK